MYDTLIGLILVSQTALVTVYPPSSSQMHRFYLGMQKLISQSKNILTFNASKTEQGGKPEPRYNLVVVLELLQYAMIS